MGKFFQKIKGKLISIGAGIGLTFILIMGFFAGVMETESTSSATYSGSYSDYVNLGDYIVKTDEEDAMPALSKSQLETAIKACYSGQGQKNMLSVLDDLISVQSNDKVNAAFMVAITQVESSGGTAWDAIDSSTYNWMSVSWGSLWNGDSGKTYTTHHVWCCYSSFNEAIKKFGVYMTQSDYYFKNNRFNVDDISVPYCDSNWATSVKREIDKMYSAVAETIPQTTADSTSTGRFENGKYTFGSRTYTVFNQHNYMDFFGYNSNGARTINSAGCGATAIATCLSGFKSGETPSTITKHCIGKGYNYTCDDNYAIPKWLGEYGLKGDRVDGFNQDAVYNHLKSGKPVILNYAGSLVLTSGSSYYTDGHFTALLGIEGNEIFNGDPGGLSGYVTKTNLQNVTLRGYYLVDKK